MCYGTDHKFLKDCANVEFLLLKAMLYSEAMIKKELILPLMRDKNKSNVSQRPLKTEVNTTLRKPKLLSQIKTKNHHLCKDLKIHLCYLVLLSHLIQTRILQANLCS